MDRLTSFYIYSDDKAKLELARQVVEVATQENLSSLVAWYPHTNDGCLMGITVNDSSRLEVGKLSRKICRSVEEFDIEVKVYVADVVKEMKIPKLVG